MLTLTQALKRGWAKHAGDPHHSCYGQMETAHRWLRWSPSWEGFTPDDLEAIGDCYTRDREEGLTFDALHWRAEEAKRRIARAIYRHPATGIPWRLQSITPRDYSFGPKGASGMFLIRADKVIKYWDVIFYPRTTVIAGVSWPHRKEGPHGTA